MSRKVASVTGVLGRTLMFFSKYEYRLTHRGADDSIFILEHTGVIPKDPQ